MRALALTLCVTVAGAAGCEFAVKHPATTSGIVGATVGLSTCEIGTDFDSNGTCGIVGAGAGVALFAIVGIAILLGGEGHTVLQEPMTEEPPPLVRDKKQPPTPAPTTTDAPP